MRTRAWTIVAVILLGLMVGAACGEQSLKGTTWKGGNIMDSNITLTFNSGGQCDLHTSFMGSPSGTYKVSGNQVSVRFNNSTYVFDMNGDSMTGTLFGAGVSLARQ